MLVELYCQLIYNGIVGKGITRKLFQQILGKIHLPEQIEYSEYHDGEDNSPDTSVLAGVDEAERAFFHRVDRT